LEKNWRQIDFLIHRGFVGDSFGELEELSRTNNRVRNLTFFD